MKISIIATSGYASNAKVIEANSIDEAIKRLQTDKELIKSIVNIATTRLDKNLIPEDFVLKTYAYEEDCNYTIEIYDDYRE